MLDYMDWHEAADRVKEGLVKAVGQKQVTYDLARQMEGAKEVKCSQFAETIITSM